MLYVFVSLLVVFGFTFYLFINQRKFGGSMHQDRLTVLQSKPNYKKGVFENLMDTPSFTEGASIFTLIRDFFFMKNERKVPRDTIPFVKTDIHQIPLDQEIVIWFGHSSYYLQTAGKRILVDPVFSGHASPLAGSIKAFPGSNTYTTDDIPDLDILLITHDHWDHLDYETVVKLQSRVAKVVTPLGVGAHFEKWGFSPSQIKELYWYDQLNDYSDIQIVAVPSRHFSGRSLKRNNTLWSSFVLKTSEKTIFVGGDSGYGDHFMEIGNQFGPFDLALLENGQYNRSWKHIHLFPEEFIQAAQDLRAQKVLPVHNSKFALAHHDWDEPMEELYKLNKAEKINLVTPKVGEVVYLEGDQNFEPWWRNIN